MNLKINDKIKVKIAQLPFNKYKLFCGKHGFNKSDILTGKIIYINAQNRFLVEFDKNIGSHSLYGIGKNGYCYMFDEKFLNKGGGFNMGKPSLLRQLLDKDLALIAKEVMDEEGNLDMNDPRVQEALLKTDGFKTELVKILKDEKGSSKKNKKNEQDDE